MQEVSYDGPDLANKEVVIDNAYVRGRLADILQKEEMGKFGFAAH